MPPPNKYKIIALLGPTCTGKTATIEKLDGKHFEIISCDSRQVYCDLTIGTAAPNNTLKKKFHTT